MYGYINVNRPELKIKEYEIYHSYYCGLCQRLKEKYGKIGQLTLSYDMTFLIILLTGLYETKTGIKGIKCMVNPFQKKPARINKYTDYVADMSIILSYYKCKDDWQDDRKYIKLAYSKLLERKGKAIRTKYGEKVKQVDTLLKKMRIREIDKEKDIDLMAGMFGNVMAEIFTFQDDMWGKSLNKIGFYLGKFIYLMDAYEDIEDDIKTKNYNPFMAYYNKPDFEERASKLLTMMMAECSREFELLPIITNVEILRNILYSGVWSRYDIIQEKRKEKQVQIDE